MVSEFVIGENVQNWAGRNENLAECELVIGEIANSEIANSEIIVVKFV